MYIEGFKYNQVQGVNAMAKKVIGATVSRQSKRIGMDKVVLGVHCDDGTVYVFERSANSPRWEGRTRIKDGVPKARPKRLPRAVSAHMDGRTMSGPQGPDGEEYWTV